MVAYCKFHKFHKFYSFNMPRLFQANRQNAGPLSIGDVGPGVLKSIEYVRALQPAFHIGGVVIIEGPHVMARDL
jgi:hypothetical protein